MNNLIVAIVARAFDLLTSGQLAYENGGRDGFASRPEAGTPLFDGIRPEGTPGIYYVPSEQNRRRFYRVDALGPDLSCECQDSMRAPGVCKHICAAAIFHAIAEVLAEEVEPEPAPAPVPFTEYLQSRKPAPAPTQARPPVGTAERANFESDDTRWLYGKKRATA